MSRMLVPSLIVAVALVGTLCWEVQSAVRSGEGDISNHPEPTRLAAAMLKPVPTDPVDIWVTTSLERPLLRESRRPDKSGAEAKGTGDDIPRLAGVVTGPFGNRAIFVMPGTAKAAVVNEGAKISNFVVQAIEPGRIVVEAEGISRTYRPLFADKDRKRCGGTKASVTAC